MDLQKIKSYQRKFVQDREWEPFHTPKNLAAALSVESGELLEIFQWLTEEEVSSLKKNTKKMENIEEEIADVFFYLLRMTDVLDIDLEDAFWKKTRKNEGKYPVELARGNAKKYTEFE